MLFNSIHYIYLASDCPASILMQLNYLSTHPWAGIQQAPDYEGDLLMAAQQANFHCFLPQGHKADSHVWTCFWGKIFFKNSVYKQTCMQDC